MGTTAEKVKLFEEALVKGLLEYNTAHGAGGRFVGGSGGGGGGSIAKGGGGGTISSKKQAGIDRDVKKGEFALKGGTKTSEALFDKTGGFKKSDGSAFTSKDAKKYTQVAVKKNGTVSGSLKGRTREETTYTMAKHKPFSTSEFKGLVTTHGSRAFD